MFCHCFIIHKQLFEIESGLHLRQNRYLKFMNRYSFYKYCTTSFPSSIPISTNNRLVLSRSATVYIVLEILSEFTRASLHISLSLSLSLRTRSLRLLTLLLQQKLEFEPAPDIIIHLSLSKCVPARPFPLTPTPPRTPA